MGPIAGGLSRVVLLVALCFPGAGAGSLGAQVPDSVPQVPDSLAVDSLRVDSLAVDSLGIPLPDSLSQDTLAVDSLPPPAVFPVAPSQAPAGWETGIWTWDREAILGARSLTLAELVDLVPGLVPIRGGDYGAPRGVAGFGGAGGAVRVFIDGIEQLPLEGSIPDLAKVPVAGADEVRVERGLGEVRIHVRRHRADDPRPYSRIEAGTGDLDTNILRGIFYHPRALGGQLGVAIERLDTRGRNDPGAASGGWLRYSFHRGDDLAVGVEFRRGAAERNPEVWDPPESRRTDWSIQTRWRPRASLLVGASYSGASLSTDSVSFPFRADSRGSYGAEAWWSRGSARMGGTVRRYSGDGLPSWAADLEATGESERFGGVSARWSREAWEGQAAARLHARAWTRPLLGLSLFAERSSGALGVPWLPALDADTTLTDTLDTTPVVDDVAVPVQRIFDQSGSRLGAVWRWRDVELGAAYLRVDGDSVAPFGLPMDREGVTMGRTSRTGYEVFGRLPLYPRGFALEGHVQAWSREGGLEPYMPASAYRGAVTFHRTFLESGNLEVWGDVGVVGREGMLVPFVDTPGDETNPAVFQSVPFYQNWYTRLQIRVVTVRIFLRVENVSLRANNQDLPGRVLPQTRSVYGIRWTLWN